MSPFTLNIEHFKNTTPYWILNDYCGITDVFVFAFLGKIFNSLLFFLTSLFCPRRVSVSMRQTLCPWQEASGSWYTPSIFAGGGRVFTLELLHWYHLILCCDVQASAPGAHGHTFFFFHIHFKLLPVASLHLDPRPLLVQPCAHQVCILQEDICDFLKHLIFTILTIFKCAIQ